MVFKFVGGITASSTSYQLWISSNTLAEKVEAALDITSTYRGHYKNRIVQKWQTFNPVEVSIDLIKNMKQTAVINIVKNRILLT